jgi:hypothetical protein
MGVNLERDHKDDLVVDSRILELILEKQDGGMDWIHLAQDRDQWWRAPVDMVMNLRVP